MTTNINTTINVYFDSAHNVQYSPNNQIQAPADSVETVIWKGIPPLQFRSTGATATNLANITSDRIVFAPGQSFAAGNTDTVTMTINNAGGLGNVSARVNLGIVDTTSTTQPPVVIDGGGSIRNKGTSLWVWELAGAIIAALLVGGLTGPRFAGLQQLGPRSRTIIAAGAAIFAGLMVVQLVRAFS
jgi:hypothetical protein